VASSWGRSVCSSSAVAIIVFLWISGLRVIPTTDRRRREVVSRGARSRRDHLAARGSGYQPNVLRGGITSTPLMYSSCHPLVKISAGQDRLTSSHATASSTPGQDVARW